MAAQRLARILFRRSFLSASCIPSDGCDSQYFASGLVKIAGANLRKIDCITGAIVHPVKLVPARRRAGRADGRREVTNVQSVVWSS
jgi:hypothetical protein